MTYDPLENLLVSAWKELAQYLPEEASHTAAYLELERISEEKDDRGNPTPQAHRAKARLRNAFLVEETNAKSKSKILKDQAKLEKELAQVVGRALVLMVTSRANASKIAHIEAHEARHLPVGASREQHDPESKFALAKPFIDKLSKANVTPSQMGRIPAEMVGVIAQMIKDHAADPKFKNPENLWSRMVRNGVVEAYLGNLDEEHLKVIAHAACERDEQTNEWAKRARAELDLPAGMDDRFLEGVARMRDAARALTEGEARAYEDAYKLQDERDVDRLAKLLQMETQEERIRLRVLLDIVHRAIAPLKRDWKMEMQLGILKREIDAVAPHAKWHKDWKAELRERLEITFERLGPMGSIEAYNALLRSGLAVSDADWEFTKRLERDVIDEHFIALENEVRAACKSDRYFKVYDNRVIYSHEPDFETIETETWTGYDWLQEYGAWPGEDAEDRDLDRMSRSPIEDVAHETDGAENQADTSNAPVMPVADADAQDPLIEDVPSAGATIAGPAGGSAAPLTEHSPRTTNKSASNAGDGELMQGADYSRAGNGSLDDEYDYEDSDDYDWQDEDPDIEPLDLNLGPEFADDPGQPHRPADQSGAAIPSKPTEPSQSGEASPGDVSSPPERPAEPSMRPRAYPPYHDDEKDDWNE